MKWEAVERIDIGRQPTITVEIFFVELFGEGTYQVLVDDRMRGFKSFEAMLLSKWPEIESAFRRVYVGAPDVSERVCVWTKQKKTY